MVSPDSDELLRTAAQADWAAIDRAWEKVGAAQRALQEFRKGSGDNGGETLAAWRHC